jgi:ACT domain-containing protein
METPAKAARINMALMVIRHTNDGMTVVAACKVVGLPRSTFYDICKRNPERIEAFNKMIEASEREELSMILTSQVSILDRVIEDGLSEKTKPRQRLSILKYLTTHLNNLADKILRRVSNPEAIKRLLSGPELEPGTSNFPSSMRDVTKDNEILTSGS